MSRSGYSDGVEGWESIRYRGAVASAIRGKRGQQFIRDLVASLDVLPSKRLIRHKLVDGEEVCAIGSVGKMRGVDMSAVNPEDYFDYDCGEEIASLFGIAPALAREIMDENDEHDFWEKETPEQRWQRVRKWAVSQLHPQPRGEDIT